MNSTINSTLVGATGRPFAQGEFAGACLNSAFQPIYGLNHRRAVGYEALIRPRDSSTGQSILPLEFFGQPRSKSQRFELDRSCQRLHIENFAAHAPQDRWLFLNIEPASIADRAYKDGTLTRALARSGLAPDLLVVEIVEGAIHDEALVSEAVDYFRSLGAMVALDDFGAGHSNFDRIWRLAPDMIKLDRSLIKQAQAHRDDRLKRMLPNLVSLIHEAGCMVVAEGIETREHALVAMEADVDFVQGFYFGFPESRIEHDCPEAGAKLDALTCEFSDFIGAQERTEKQALSPYLDMFRAVVAAIGEGKSITESAAHLLSMAGVARFYVLAGDGSQIIHLAHDSVSESVPYRLAPIANTSGGVWNRRSYFRNAVNEPRRLHLSRPYLSSAGSNLCRTLSIATDGASRRVFCCDIYSA